MISTKLPLIILVIVVLDIVCGQRPTNPCPNGGAPLPGYFCGRGPTHQDCPNSHQCIIAPDDTYAVCCPRVRRCPCQCTDAFENPCPCPMTSNTIESASEECSTESDSSGNLKG